MMSTLPILEVVSFSTEHPVNKVSNLLKSNDGKWTNPLKNVSTAAKGREVTEIEAEFRIPLCKIHALDVGNYWTAILEIEVGRSGESASSRLPLLKSSPLLLMNRMDCSNGGNAQAMKFITKSEINPQVLSASKGWDRLRVVCKQHLKNDVLFGLSTLLLRGKRLDELVFCDNPILQDNHSKHSKAIENPDGKEDRPDWYVPGSRASKLVETSLKSSKFSFKPMSNEVVKENIKQQPHFVSPDRKRLREDDDLASVVSLSKSSRDQVVLQDWNVSNVIKKEKFKFVKKGSKVCLDDAPISPDRSENASNTSQAHVSNNHKVSGSKEKFWFKKKDSSNVNDEDVINSQSSSSERKDFYRGGSSASLSITKPDDYLRHTEAQLKASGMLVQTRSYKKSRELPLLDGSELKVSPGQSVTFIKQGKLILMLTQGKTYEPLVEKEHITAIFKDYSKADIIANSLKPTPVFLDMKCPLCCKSFGQNEEKLIRHASTCNGMEELVQDVCPICEREYPPEQLPDHAQQCAQQMYD